MMVSGCSLPMAARRRLVLASAAALLEDKQLDNIWMSASAGMSSRQAGDIVILNEKTKHSGQVEGGSDIEGVGKRS